MKRSLVALTSVLIFLFPVVSVAREGDPEWRGELQSYLDRAAGALEVPGAAVLVVSREEGTTILTHGVRCAGGEDPVTPQTSFGIGSLTKAFTATAAAILVGDGVIDWDTKARAQIPDLELADPVATKNLTLRDLLAHRSGLGDHALLVLNVDAAPAWVLPRLAMVEAAAEFRDRHVYSGLGYTVAGEMIGRADGTSWSETVSRRLLEPLGMTSTTVGPPPAEEVEVACGYHRWNGEMAEIEELAFGAAGPGSGLYSTAEDMARWLELLVGWGQVDSRRIVDARALGETWKPQVVIRNFGPRLRAYGLGWYVTSLEGQRHLFHGGGGAGFTSQVRLFPGQGVAVAVLSNVAAGGLPDLIAERASDLVLGGVVGEDLVERAVRMTARLDEIHRAPGAALRETADPDAPPTLELSEYAGCYDNPAFGRFELRVDDDIVVACFHGIDVDVEHLRDDFFLLSSAVMGDMKATFAIDGGTVSSVSMLLGSPEGERVFTRGTGSCAEGSARTGS